MKSKLRGFRLRRSEPKDKIDFLPPAQLDELAQAAQVLFSSLLYVFGVDPFLFL
jgi:hypothetical protein